MSTVRARTAALLAIGDEVLRGEVVNGNAAYLAERLFDLGFGLREHAVVSDEPEDIRAAVLRLTSEVDVLVATGGLGPTEDDRTVEVVSALLGSEPVVHQPSLEAMERAFAARGFALTPNNLRQTRVPGRGEALPNAAGIAPGFAVTLGRAEAYFLPGVPREMQRIFSDHVGPRLARNQEAAGVVLPAVRSWHVYGMGESHIDHRLAGLVKGVEGASLHFRTALPENHVKIVVRGSDAESNRAVLERLDAEVRARLGEVVYGADEDTFPLAVARALRAAGASLAFAESCTGGYAGQLVTSEPGASEFFRGAVVCYADQVKVDVLGVRSQTLRDHGAVSEPCAAEMAEGARRVCAATLAVSITGIAGSQKDGGIATAPSPSSPGGKPVGLVCFGVAGPRGTQVDSRRFLGGRERIRRAAAFHALDLARRYF
jgi:nicotinamide-nucleotide amidase